MYILTNGKIVLADGIQEGKAIVIKGKFIEAIIDREQVENYQGYQILDVQGNYISPGFIDTHSDYIEKVIAPRPQALMDYKLGIKETERILMTHGITTMFHSLSLYNDDLFGKNIIRRPEHAQRIIHMINEMHDEKHLIRHRVHARYEIDNLFMVDTVIQLIQEGKIHYLSLMDHTPGQGQYSSIDTYRQTILSYGSVDETTVDDKIKQRIQTPKLSIEEMQSLIHAAHQVGISVASHDDDSLEKLDFNRELGIDISEFPIKLEVAKAAKAKGFMTVGGAPNILLGGSHSGNMAVSEGIQHDAIDIICSDYYPSGLVHAIFQMHDQFGVPIHEMINRLSLNPARALKLEGFGQIKEGYYADIITISVDEDRYPAVDTVFVGGVPVIRTKYRKGGYPVG
ncbi:alpha-D-ribose 1-methylphosphonate 5-triphosphate diphosphatase [Vaginisenegalia massiliensis]|uniref:alpha-D-ribose 1-methylphosphonate 5-triphosphate diphosphatase n=1 Tax=Vaginisenegalia massiliensis TaxID=2058294 RepID=UPI000F5278CD|nr:alpha-D-ribose 1-methylphosphonate 5-triphosphate diphosphatase [Vaginisenegalia massiliensis]